MTTLTAFIAFMEANGFGTLGNDLFPTYAPKTPDSLWWVRSSGGFRDARYPGQSTSKLYRISVFYRDTDAQAVDQKLFDLEEVLNRPGGVELSGFVVTDCQVTSFPADNDLDGVERKVGTLQVQLTILKEYT